MIQQRAKFFDSEAKGVCPYPESAVVRNGATPPLRCGLLDHGIADLSLDLDKQAVSVVHLNDEVRQMSALSRVTQCLTVAGDIKWTTEIPIEEE